MSALKLNSGDYFITKIKNKQHLCIKLDGGFRAVLESTMMTDDPQHIDYDPALVYCNLGREPMPGSYCGVNVRPYVETVESNRFGPMHLCTKLEPAALKNLKKALRWAFDWYEEHAVTSFLPLKCIYVYPNKGKMVGCYVTKNTKEGNADEIHIMFQDYSDAQFNKYACVHEMAHGLWHRCVSESLKARWLKLYHKRLKQKEVKETRLRELFEGLIGNGYDYMSYSRDLAEDEDRLMLREVARYFGRVHKMTVRHINNLLIEDVNMLGDLWPTSSILTEENPDLSQYAMKSVEEFFAEAISLHSIGKIVPKDVRKGIETTFKSVRSAV